jgi:adenosylcobyric acid synthase
MTGTKFHLPKEGLRSIMFVGTGSNVGKSVITTGFCRIFKQDGYHPAPFKAQNMSLNSYATPEGLEIGRAQAVQAEACSIPCHTDMNPVLLKPTTDRNSQLVLHGKPAGNFSAVEYFLSGNRETLFAEVKKAYHRLAVRHSPIVMEGAGSISELNLKHRDITNMRMALEAGAATYLIADIDRGGVFGSLYGTIALLTPEERTLIKGIIINKFRGDPQLFEEGRVMLEDLCQTPVVGILPFFRDIFIEEEDSIALRYKQNRPVSGKVNIGVVLLNRLSNFTDFDRLGQDPRVNLFFTRDADTILKADIVILPGSKNTLEDLMALKDNGVAEAILKAFKNQKTVIGICGGYQMMGEVVEDPLHVETGRDPVMGLGLLPVRTVMQPEKTTRQCSFRFRDHQQLCKGYEIHMGVTQPSGDERPLNYFPEGGADGYFLHDKCWGTYLHGILDNREVIDELISPYTELPGETSDYPQYKEQQYDRLAALIRQHIDMEKIYKTLQS